MAIAVGNAENVTPGEVSAGRGGGVGGSDNVMPYLSEVEWSGGLMSHVARTKWYYKSIGTWSYERLHKISQYTFLLRWHNYFFSKNISDRIDKISLETQSLYLVFVWLKTSYLHNYIHGCNMNLALIFGSFGFINWVDNPY